MILITEKDTLTAGIQSLLLEHDIRQTAQRMEIASALLCRPQHLSADQVMARVNKTSVMVSKATVYNTLNLFAEKGIVREVIIESGKVFYDSNTDVHHHIYNEDTGMLLDVNATKMTIENIPDLPAGTIQSGVDVIIRVRNKT